MKLLSTFIHLSFSPDFINSTNVPLLFHILDTAYISVDQFCQPLRWASDSWTNCILIVVFRCSVQGWYAWEHLVCFMTYSLIQLKSLLTQLPPMSFRNARYVLFFPSPPRSLCSYEKTERFEGFICMHKMGLVCGIFLQFSESAECFTNVHLVSGLLKNPIPSSLTIASWLSPSWSSPFSTTVFHQRIM